MKSFFVSTILVLTFCVGAFAQTSETSPCPTIDLTGLWEVTKLDEPIVFRVEVSQEVHNFNAKYNWSVSSGEIIEGQGTLTIKVLRKELGKYITAALEITGLPKECVNSASETEPTCSCPVFRKIDEFSILASRIDKARLDNLLIELQNNPLEVAYIFERFERKTSQNVVERKIQKITDYLVKEKRIEKDRFVISTGESDKNLTQYFLVPPGAPPPEIKDYN